MRLIDISPCEIGGHASLLYVTEEGCLVQTLTSEIPTIDAVPVVRCDSCVLEGNCFAESHFRFAGIENPFCCAGKRKEGAD